VKKQDIAVSYTRCLEKSTSFNWIFSKNPTKNSIKGGTFFSEHPV